MGDRQGKLQILTFVVRYTLYLDHTKIEGNNRPAGGESRDRSKCKDFKEQGRGWGKGSLNEHTYSTMKTVLQLICAPRSFTCNSPSCRLAPSTVLRFVSSARAFLSPLTVIFCRAGPNYTKGSINKCDT